jgi:regulatory protein
MRAKRSADAGEPAEWTAATVEAAAVRLLARREHSRAELARKLEERGVPAELAAETLDSLAARRLQSDARYAEVLIASRAGRGQGPVRIRRELAERGVAAAIIDAAFDAAGTDWFELARQVRRRRFGAGEAPGEWEARVRQSRFLEYRGFSSDQIRHAFGHDDD